MSRRTGMRRQTPADKAGRLFVGVPLDEHARAAVAAHLGAPGRELPGRRVAPGNWHLTLRFLGDTTTDALAALRTELTGSDPGPSFDVHFGRLGAFPRPNRARVLWLGVEDERGRLRGLAEAVEDAARRAGFEPERRPFRSHLTLSRLRTPADVRDVLDGMPAANLTMAVTEFVLFRSHLSRSGPRYEALARYRL